MSTKYNEEAEDLMFELFDEDDFTKVISFVDKYGCDFVDRDGRNLLMNFIVEGKSTFAIELIKQYKMNGLNLDLQDDSGWTALHFAAQENSPEIIELLAGSKANLNIQEENGRTPLFIAIFDRNDKSAITLLENGADITVNNNSGVSPMSFVTKKVKKWINENLEAIAKQLYDYWFVQFDFPDENGRPYKSSGGEMVWNEKLKREVPKSWKDITFNSFINKNKAGDWGYDMPKDGTIKVGCVRGADIVKLNDIPIRYITSKHSDRLLEDGDIVIEVSGGSPVQATGRVALITNGVIERNGGTLVCSNFCQSFSMKKRVFSEYFYYLWQNLYDNDNMFNFEGKTSGIKNFQTEVFLANYWFEVPEQLIETFHAVVSQYHLMIDLNIIENNNLIKQRDELLPLLMNGQALVNSDLSHD